MRDPKRIGVAASSKPAAVFASNLLQLRGKDLRPLPLLKRKAALEKELKRTQRIVYCQHVGESGEKLFQAADQLGLEDARFEKDNGRAIRSTAWLIERADAPYRRGPLLGLGEDQDPGHPTGLGPCQSAYIQFRTSRIKCLRCRPALTSSGLAT